MNGFGKGGLLEKWSFQKSRDSRAFRDSREPPTVENKGESDHCLDILENLEILEILEIPPRGDLFRNDPFFCSRNKLISPGFQAEHIHVLIRLASRLSPGSPRTSPEQRFMCTCLLSLSGSVLRATVRLSQRYPRIAHYGVLRVSTWPNWWDTPRTRGYLSDTCAISYENKAERVRYPLLRRVLRDMGVYLAFSR